MKIAAAIADALAMLGVGPAAERPLPEVPLGPADPAGPHGDVDACAALQLTWLRSPGAQDVGGLGP